MANQLLTISDITNEGLMVLENELTLTDKINREYSDRYAVAGAKIGYTENIRMPARVTVSGGPALAVQDFVENSVPVTLTNQAHTDTQFQTSDLLLSMDMFKTRVLKPQIAALANSVDSYVATYMKNYTANVVGTPGTSPTAITPFLTAGSVLDTEPAPRDGQRYAVVDQFTQASMIGGQTTLFNPQALIGEQYKKGILGKQIAGFDFYMDQNIVTQTYGNWTTGSSVKYSTSGTSSALLTSGWARSGTLYLTGFTNATSTVNVGDTFTIAGVYMANAQNRAGTKQLRTFTVIPPAGTPSNGTFTATKDVFGNTVGGTYNADSSGNLQVTVSVCIISAGQFQNVGAAPANNAVVTPTATSSSAALGSPQALTFHRDAFTFVSADLPIVGGVDQCARASDSQVGISMRITRQYMIGNDALPTRIDILYGVGALYPEFASRVAC
jgi:hypothetical protein